jgi:dTDP-4-dehydrorhamnose reductase
VRIFVTGAGGFVGSNLVNVFAVRHDAEVLAPDHRTLDVGDAAAVKRAIAATRPDAVVHAAIWNRPQELTSDRARAWSEYVGATRNVVDAANAIDARVVLISTDWVFDGTQGPARESDPPNPINPYGFLKAASELVVTERAARGTVARVAAVQGVHQGGRRLPRSQDAGFGYLVVSLVEALRAGETFTVWDGDGLNRLATPTLASDAAELVWRALERDLGGILHCCGSEHCDRVELARRAVAAFDLDPERLEVGPPPAAALPPPGSAGGGIPVDTRLDTTATAAALDTALPDLDAMLAALRAELDQTLGLTMRIEERTT